MSLLSLKRCGNKDAKTLMLVHGWGCDSRVWQSFLPYLIEHYHVVVIDLPGVGQSQWVGDHGDNENLSIIIHHLANATEEPAVWFGWSLGAALATLVAHQYPAKVSELITVAFNPCFVQKKGWESATSADVYTSFYELFIQNRKKAMQQFGLLQTMGSETYKDNFKYLMMIIQSCDYENATIPLFYLKLLDSLDLRVHLGDLQQPVMHIIGEKDQLVPQSIHQGFYRINKNHCVNIINEAAHVPFISHPEKCALLLNTFIQD